VADDQAAKLAKSYFVIKSEKLSAIHMKTLVKKEARLIVNWVTAVPRHGDISLTPICEDVGDNHESLGG